MRMAKSGKLLFMLILVLLITVGCSEQQTSTGNQNKIRIGVTNMTMKESVYYFMKKGAEDKAKELGVDLIWQSSENDPSIQLNQVQDFVAQGADVIAIEPARSDAAQPHVRLAHDADIPVINFGAQIRGEKTELRITEDMYKVGAAQVEDFAKVWGDKQANVVILSGTKGDELADSSTHGVLDTLKKFPQYKIIVQQAHMNWDRQLAMNTMENALTKFKNDITVVFANNDTMAHGAIKAAENAGVKDKILFYGADADQDSIELLKTGMSNLKVFEKNPYLQGTRIVEAAVKLARGEAVTTDGTFKAGENEIPIWWTPIQLIDKDSLEPMKTKYPALFK
ncbi:sugar ABC transporter substrate-binding protein [Brevibacillus sp. NRS-1366]|uniref:sugar ABC transporter substrate-binding protein n=1 Tax=Brevibacillus sp. NRS-1366 TaxID=3233899 RepID=UPI003D221B8B